MCGKNPTGTSAAGTAIRSFATSDILQAGTNGDLFQLGKYSSSTWTKGAYSGQVAYRVLFTNGDSSGCGFPRQAKVTLICNTAYAATSPLISVSEPSTCSCKLTYHCIIFIESHVFNFLDEFTVFTIAVCSTNTAFISASPTILPTSAVPSSSPTVSFYTQTTICNANSTYASLCQINCNGVSYDLKTAVVTTSLNGVTQRYFEYRNDKRYEITIPLCGAYPTGTAPSGLAMSTFSSSVSIWQYAASQFFSLGLYQSTGKLSVILIEF
jgi:hypothetical protein